MVNVNGIQTAAEQIHGIETDDIFSVINVTEEQKGVLFQKIAELIYEQTPELAVVDHDLKNSWYIGHRAETVTPQNAAVIMEMYGIGTVRGEANRMGEQRLHNSEPIVWNYYYDQPIIHGKGEV